jgi:hypothetical protein
MSNPWSTAPTREPPKRKFYRYQPTHVRVDALHYPGSKEELGEIPIPCIKLRGLWMEAAGFEVGARLKLEVSQGSIHLTIEQPPKPVIPKVRKMGRLQLARLQQTPLHASPVGSHPNRPPGY